MAISYFHILMHLFIINLSNSLIIDQNNDIFVAYGTITIIGYNSCTIILNDDFKTNIVNEQKNNDNEIEVPGLWFGKISYECNNVVGTLISIPKCKPCISYCVYNDLIPKCRTNTYGIILGITIPIILMLIIVLSCYKPFNKIWHLVYTNFIISIMQHYNDKRRAKNVRRHNKSTGDNRKVVFGNIHPDASSKSYLRITKYRDNLTKNENECEYENLPNVNDNIERIDTIKKLESNQKEILTGNAKSFENIDCCSNVKENIKNKPTIIPNNKSFLYPDITNDANGASFNTLPNAPNLPITPTKYRKSKSSLAPIILGGIVAASVFDPSIGCDTTLFLSSEGKICSSLKCVDMYTYSITLIYGQVICFKTIDNEIMRISIDESVIKTRYQKMYLTSDFDINIDYYSSCKGKGECWTGGCSYNTKGENFENNPKDLYNLSSYGCEAGVVGCDTWCYHQISCTYYNYWLTEKGPKSAVFKKTSQIWETNIKICYKKSCKMAKFNTNNPMHNLNGKELKDIISDMPIVVTNFQFENLHTDNFLIEDSVVGIMDINAAEINFPQIGIIGDYQISLNDKGRDYPISYIQCFSESCAVNCVTNEPSLRKLRRTYKHNKANKINTYKIIDKYGIENSYKTMSTVTLNIANVEFTNLHVELATCMLSVVMSYACEGCNIKPYAIISAFNIRQEGMLPIETNCSLSSRFLSCNPEPQVVNFEKYHPICYIYIINTNQTLLVSSNITFIGTIDMTKPMSSIETFSEAAKRLTSSSEFWTSVNWTLGIFAGITTIITMSTKILRTIVIYKAGKAAEKV